MIGVEEAATNAELWGKNYKQSMVTACVGWDQSVGVKWLREREMEPPQGGGKKT